MTAILDDVEPASSETRVRTIVRELPGCVDRLPGLTGSPPQELWSLYLGATGLMAYTDPGALDPRSPRVLGVPDGFARPATTRLRLLRSALRETADLLGDPEAGYRTGFTTDELHDALRELFDVGVLDREA